MDPILQEHRLLERSRVVQKAYVAHLTRLLDEREADRCSTSRVGACVYQLETPIRFGHPGAGLCSAGTGCHAAEEWGAWMGAETFRIVLPLPHPPDPDCPYPLTLVLEAQHFIAGERRRSPIRIFVNSELVHKADETRPGPHLYALPLPARLVRSVDRLSIQIEGQNPQSPAALGLSNDERMLSVGLIALTIHETARMRTICRQVGVLDG